MKECPKCKNTSFNKDGQCTYCVWKGDAGPGLLLKELIKKANDERKPKKEVE